MVDKSGVIPDPGGGGELEEDPRQRASRLAKERWASMSDAERAEHKEKVREGQQRRRERDEGKRGGDSAPKSKRQQSSATSADRRTSELGVIREVLGTVLAAPSAVGAVTGDPWLTTHFVTSAPPLADAIVAEAARNDAFRAWLYKLASSARSMSLVGAVAMYLAPPLMHYGMLPGGAMLGVPARGGPTPGAPPPPAAHSVHFVAPERGPATSNPEFVQSAMRPIFLADDDGFAATSLNGEAESLPPLPIEPA